MDYIKSRDDVTSIIRKNRKRFECPEFLFAEDSGLLSFSNEKLKILVLFLSNGRFRSGSNTFNALNNIIHSFKDVFIDFCYFPHPDDLKLYDELGIPYVRGSRSGFLIKDFDIILVSVSVIKEVVNIPVIFHHDGIPFGFYERREKNYPIIALGGSSAHVLSIACGNFIVNRKRDTSLVDIVNFGKGGQSIPELINKCLENYPIRCNALNIIESLSNRWLKVHKLRFHYDKKGIILKELSGQKVILDRGSTVEENFNNKICNLDGSYVDRTDILISYGCNGRGYCSFCLEGAVGGCWKEKSIPDIERDIIHSRFNLWTESCGVFSYNANYHSQIEYIAELSKKYYLRSSVLMSRADVYSKSSKYIDICKSLGTIKLSIAAEGISDKIRNDFLNKRLSKEELHDAVHNLMSNEILTLKINYILTGREIEDDFEEWVSDISDMLKYKEENHYKTRISLTITNLVIYDMTPLRYEERSMGLNSIYYKDNKFIDMFLSYTKKISSQGVGITVYGTGMVNAFEQLILDLGYMGTGILINSVIKDGLRYDRDVTKSMCSKFFKRVETTYCIESLFKKREPNSWFPSNLIDYGSKKMISCKQESYKDTSCEHCINPCK